MNEETEKQQELKEARLFAITTFARLLSSERNKFQESLKDNRNFHCEYRAPGKRWNMTVTEIDSKKCPECSDWMEAAEHNWYCPGCGHTPLFEEGEP